MTIATRRPSGEIAGAHRPRCGWPTVSNTAPARSLQTSDRVTAPPESYVESAEIISEADANLYEAKRTGRNRVVASEIR